jgi:hypothetical protein
MADNVHWLRDTYGPALRAFYADLLKQPVPQRFVDLVATFEAASDAAAPAPEVNGSRPAAPQPHAPQPDTTE